MTCSIFLWMFHICHYVLCIHLFWMGNICMHPIIPTSKKIFNVGLFRIILYLLGVSAELTYWMSLEFHSCAHVKFWYNFCRLTNYPWLLVNGETFPRYLYGFNHFWMVRNSHIIGLGWCFPDISNLEII